jgi:transcriptional regulator with XRE-family HTH domain
MKWLRVEANMTQRQLSDLTCIPQSTLSNLESGRSNPTDRERRILAAALGCGPEQLTDQVVAS